MQTVGGNGFVHQKKGGDMIRKLLQKLFGHDIEKAWVEMIVEELKRLAHRHPTEELVSIELIYGYGNITILELSELQSFYGLSKDDPLQE
ncbi:MAG: hypothetical protein GC178_17900 [Flavobacteriales bacterium]|nr:hypothetical protein [Flavobacteriales bacterium]